MKIRIENALVRRRSGVGRMVSLGAVLLFVASLAIASGGRVEGVVNVNTATSAQLQVLPGIGEARARAIIGLRKQRGGIENLAQLTEVRGVGEALLQELRPHLTLEGRTTIRRP